MSTQNRRSSITSSQTSSLAKRHAESAGKAAVFVPEMAKKRPALANVTNQKHGFQNGSRNSVNLVPYPAKIYNANKENCTNIVKAKPVAIISNKTSDLQIPDGTFERITYPPGPCSMDLSPDNSDGLSVSTNETTSFCDSMKSPEVEYIDKSNVAEIDSIERKTCNKLHISEQMGTTGLVCKRDILADMETSGKVVNVDDNFMDPQLCATMACDIYKHLRASEAKRRPSADFMEKVQTDITVSMRAILVDWLVEVAEEYRLVPDTLYLTVNYIDRYLSGNKMDRQRLQLLGVACMMIASKYEEICPPQVEEFCYITDNTYFKDEVLEMESTVLNFLKFEMTAPTVKCFLRRLVRAAQGVSEAPSMQLECMSNYLAELSLLEYSMLRYAPSLIAASAIFLARLVLFPSRRPWNPTLQHYARYEPSDLRECVNALHNLACNSLNSNLPAVREKYSEHKYKFVAKYSIPAISQEYFLDLSCQRIMS